MTDETTDDAVVEDSPVTVPVEAVPAAPAEDKIGITHVSGTVPAQVTGPPLPVKSVQPVSEAAYRTDRVITDTSDPLAVQVPEPDSAPHPFGITV